MKLADTTAAAIAGGIRRQLRPGQAEAKRGYPSCASLKLGSAWMSAHQSEKLGTSKTMFLSGVIAT